MSAVVWIEMLARPGALARAQTGLASIPRPVRALRRRGQRVARYAEITRIAARHGLGPLLGLGNRDATESGRPLAVRLRRTFEDCGGMFIKLGQVLATRSDLLPTAVAGELAKLQDRVPPADPTAIREVLEQELGPVDETFRTFDWAPLATASIGQAHRAVLRDGQPVVVKVQRPGVAEAVGRDIAVLTELARLVEQRTSWGADYQVVSLAGEFRRPAARGAGLPAGGGTGWSGRWPGSPRGTSARGCSRARPCSPS